MLGHDIFDKEITHFFIVSMCRIIRKRLIIKTNRLITDKKKTVSMLLIQLLRTLTVTRSFASSSEQIQEKKKNVCFIYLAIFRIVHGTMRNKRIPKILWSADNR